jgi:hypothetical protein
MDIAITSGDAQPAEANGVEYPRNRLARRDGNCLKKAAEL